MPKQTKPKGKTRIRVRMKGLVLTVKGGPEEIAAAQKFVARFISQLPTF
jgi:hypothetical protein